MCHLRGKINNMKKYVIFDFDGTIINTNDVIIASWEATFEHFLGNKESVPVIVSTFGETLEYTISQRFPEHDLSTVLKYYKDFQSEHCAEMVVLFDGIVELLEKLNNRGYKLAIATSRLSGSFREYMDGFELWGYFDACIVKEDVAHHKPHPESCLVALEKLGARPEEAVMLGDTKFDIGCANNAGVDSVLVGWNPLVDAEKIIESGYYPTYIVNSTDELFDILDEEKQ